VLERILRHKREEVALRQRQLGLAELRRRAAAVPPSRDFLAGLGRERVAVIAEIKRASPSRGPLAPDLDPAVLARQYELGGAAAISVLTDELFFAGSLSDLRRARGAASLPLLCKDFVVDEYQLYEARAAGADAVLLIVAALEHWQLPDYVLAARGLGLACLVEAHDEADLERALACGVRLIGVNSRDLRTFAVDLATVEKLAQHLPDDCTLVAESGVHTVADVERLAAAGADAVLVGAALVKAPDVAAKLRELGSVPRRGRSANQEPFTLPG
jgi:indole-3-glycerol phosphate synthase